MGRLVWLLVLACPACSWVEFDGPDGDGDADADTDADSDGDTDADADGDTDADADGDADADADADTDADTDADADADADGDGDADRQTCESAESCEALALEVFASINAHREGAPHPWDDRVAAACVEQAQAMALTGVLSNDGLGDRLDDHDVRWLSVGGDLARIATTVDVMVDDFFAEADGDWIGEPRPTGVGVAPDADGIAYVAAIVIFEEQ